MSMSSSHSVALRQGNGTVRQLMVEVLQGADFEVVIADDPSCMELADLLVVDVDSDVRDVLDWVSRFEEAGKPVLTCGVHASRVDYTESPWLSRPFTGATFLQHCQELLGISVDKSDQDVIPPAIAGFSDDPPTVELHVDDAANLEHELGLEPGILRSAMDGSKPKTSDRLALKTKGAARSCAPGGEVVSAVRERLLDTGLLEAEARQLPQIGAPPSIPANPTLPDTPAAVRESSRLNPQASPRTPHTPSHASRVAAGTGASGLSLEAIQTISAGARMLAESWDRLGLAARTEDRADRIERALFALFKNGVGAASEELQRIPMASGLCGNLDALPLVDLFHTIRGRKLRGRLELCVPSGAYVLYIDKGIMEDIDTLGGTTDDMLLRILHDQGAISDEVHERFVRAQLDDDGLSAPLEMRLRAERLVSDGALRGAKRVRAKEIFESICGSRRGNFSFIEIRQGGGQAWPVDGLKLNIDEMLLEILRELAIDTGHSEATARTSLVIDPMRAEGLNPGALTETERQMMRFFQKAETLGQARDQLGDGSDEVDRVVHRLKSVELLKRGRVNERAHPSHREVTPSTPLPAYREAAPIEHDTLDPSKARTAVSNWEIAIPSADTTDEDFVSDAEIVDEIDLQAPLGQPGSALAELMAREESRSTAASHSGVTAGSPGLPAEPAGEETDLSPSYALDFPFDEPLLNTRELDDLLAEAIFDEDDDPNAKDE